ncbi:hypothetical protein VTL71DRAFT_1197 [Oculimacula yallundae]|uniref:Uncharacterized protein n=1 Tax=Oculimacula yallundae TaxID=86028 RepID=A0ABR4D280_9HELO
MRRHSYIAQERKLSPADTFQHLSIHPSIVYHDIIPHPLPSNIARKEQRRREMNQAQKQTTSRTCTITS